jgi:septum formation protein
LRESVILLLASRSPQRREILSRLGIAFELVETDIEELTAGDPEAVVLENARRKARAGLEARGGAGPVLGVDTEVVLDGAIFGQPRDEEEARGFLECLSGREHEVLSGLSLLDAPRQGSQPRERAGVTATSVTFRDLDAPTIEQYIASGEWKDRAGGYAIQGLGGALVDRIEGDFWSVVGLPVQLLLQLAPELLPQP